MNAALMLLQVALALHTLMGAAWKFSATPAQTMPSLAVIPQPAWLAMSVLEIACGLALLLPVLLKRGAAFVPLAAGVVAAEMLLYTGLHFASGARDLQPPIYWLVVAALSVVLVLSRRPARA
ncbi:MAG: hypothetical protein U0704_04780 [Candidatus Eisenbacteria bacterium]